MGEKKATGKRQLAVFSRFLQIVGTSNMMKTGFVVVFIH